MKFEAAARMLFGTWRLTLYEDREAEADPWSPTFGVNPKGLVVYDPAGLLSVLVFAGTEPVHSWPYVGYLGTYRVREAGSVGDSIVGIVEHHVEAGTHPLLLEEHPDRPFTISGNQLMLGDGLTARRLFTRADAR